ncbi:hypothetical protein [Pseudomonas monteilii]|uniref:hypothetical protein n=1 Tax=Pseudomonas monteilii TaxID=76759 RepID=UPI001E484D63|nr:hypothetical protein [Pseudomonas monteilii]MCE0935069.1 hypothetical protein [Pseudomonas monteilii]WJR42056.1 hypothetical protein LU662_014010 [Pseudomonas monteilii]
MASRKLLQPSNSFKAPSNFYISGANGTFPVSLRVKKSGLINTWFNGLRVAYTPLHAHLVALSLVHSLVHLNLSLPGDWGKEVKKLQDLVFLWAEVIIPSLHLSQDADPIIHKGHGANFVARGALQNPDPKPDIAFSDKAQATYDLLIRPHEASVLLKFACVEWLLSPDEVQWLAKQLWAAAFLAAKQYN